jgi:outer membrane protein assembly factor BamE (lipoprotein component of BamABCDE complex)
MTKHIFAVFAISAALSACSPNVESRGHVAEMEAYTQIKVGETTRDQVLQTFGSPSTTASFGQETWYYVTAKKESFAFFKPEITDQNVVRVAFNTDGTVAAVEKFDKSSMQEIAITKRETATEGQELTFIEQLLGNVGRFNSPGTTPGSAGGMSGARGRR